MVCSEGTLAIGAPLEHGTARCRLIGREARPSVLPQVDPGGEPSGWFGRGTRELIWGFRFFFFSFFFFFAFLFRERAKGVLRGVGCQECIGDRKLVPEGGL